MKYLSESNRVSNIWKDKIDDVRTCPNHISLAELMSGFPTRNLNCLKNANFEIF